VEFFNIFFGPENLIWLNLDPSLSLLELSPGKRRIAHIWSPDIKEIMTSHSAHAGTCIYRTSGIIFNLIVPNTLLL